ncbi:hypothetical protein [Alistipes senegalensis]|uniref:hypothetical protein n=1 Tax=Alistipes senegalensis TaxID=1288121 RepID=UPI00101BC1B5|nr:hypothetical protein [Alistipes senegalensis]
MKKALCIFALLGPLTVFGSGPRIGDSRINISWQKSREGWQPRRIELRDEGQTFVWGTPDGGYTVLYTPETPPTEGEIVVNRSGDTLRFDIDRFHCIAPSYRKATSSVPLNRAGEAFRLVPQEMHRSGDTLRFEASGEPGQLTAEWWADTIHPGDLCVRMTFTAARAGYYSLSTPATATLPEKQLAWGCVPGFFQGAAIEPDFHLAYMYGQGLPHLPVICNENTVTTMVSLLTDTQGLTLAVIPEPGYDRKPYVGDRRTHGECWRTGLSHMTRDGRLCPTAWHPVLGEEGSWLEAGGQIRFAFRYTLRRTDWYEVFKHVVYDIYGLKEELALRRSRISLTDRLEAICRYVCDDSLSLWRTEYCEGIEIGAQAYLGSVVGSEKDAMKNADAGAVWMLAAMTGDSLLRHGRLPYIRNFKLMQQGGHGDRNRGAALGQYYLSKKGAFVEEWGNHIEPIGITYYTLIDIGNILLFEPQDTLLREKLREGADLLLSLQHPDGSFDVAYDKLTGKALFTDLEDLRPTFYGLLVAHRILGERKYLDAALRGADWYVGHAVDRGRFLGVCGDARFINDFATVQSAQALLETYEASGNERYLDAAVRAARLYACSVYTHPRSENAPVRRKGRELRDWQLSQTGLCFEHGGSTGSATKSGPILLTSHCGLYTRLTAMTGDSLFVDLARTAAIAREEFLHPDTKIATYYWSQFDRGPGPFPHHAWWQLGWIVDYLLCEAECRSDGLIAFPRGFVTPKVGPQRITGFAPGRIGDDEANLILRPGLVRTGCPDLDCLTALSTDGRRLYVVLLGSSAHENRGRITLNVSKLGWQGIGRTRALTAKTGRLPGTEATDCTIDGFGLKIWEITRK